MSKEIKDVLNDEDKFKKVVKETFDIVDLDKSGMIDSKELGKIVIQLAEGMGSGPPSQADVQDILNHLDVDKNGEIDFEEFSQFIRDILTSMIEED